MGLYEEEFDDIYSTMMGNQKISGSVPWVENGFAEGSKIAESYRIFWTAREHLCRRFDLDWEDKDLEAFMNGILELEGEVAYRMFLYGIGFAQRGYRL